MTKLRMKKLLKITLFLNLGLFATSCDQTKEYLHKWQKYVVYKRYGIDIDKRSKIDKWEEDVKKYEKEIDEKISAGANLAKVYRKIGEAYAGMQMYEPCVDYLEKAIHLGYASEDILFMQALCKGSLARLHNWDEKYRNDAEAGFLKVLNKNPEFNQAKIELALLYFYGFGSNSKFSVNSEKVSSSQKEYREKAEKLAKDYTMKVPQKPDGHIILAGMYSSMGKRSDAIVELQFALDLYRRNYPNDYLKNENYREALMNLNRLEGKK